LGACIWEVRLSAHLVRVYQHGKKYPRGVYLAVRDQLNQYKFLEGLHLNGSGDMPWAAHTDFKKIFGSSPILESSQCDPPNVMIHQVVVVTQVG